MEMHNLLSKEVTDTHTCVVAILAGKKGVLMGMRNYTKDVWKDISVWTSPGGRCDMGETIEQGLRREVREEVGITKLSIEGYIGSVHGAIPEDTLYLFYATTDEEPVLMEPEKFSKWEWIPMETWLADAQYGGFNEGARGMTVEFLEHLRG